MSGRAPGHASVVVEVATVTIFTHVAYKALKLVEPAGQNLAPGLVLLLAAATMIWIHRPSLADYGIVSPRWREGVSLGTATSAAIFVAWVLALLARTPGASTALPRGLAGLACIAAAAAAGSARRRRCADAPHPSFAISIWVGILLAIAWIGLALGATPANAASDVAGRVLAVSLGEEVFFRGYVQSRANEAFGRPVNVLGVACGPGLLVSAALFAMVHLLNPTLYSSGHWEVSWRLGALTFGSGLVFGYLREMTSSLWAGVLVHGISGACGAVR